jgi:hypothetical protein
MTNQLADRGESQYMGSQDKLEELFQLGVMAGLVQISAKRKART